MTNYEVFEGNGTPKSELATNPDIVVGDTIVYVTNNQEGYTKHRVVLDKNGDKDLELIDDYDMQEARMQQPPDDEENDVVIGNKRKRPESSSPTNYEVFEGSRRTPESELKTNPDIVVGDTIEMVTNNQEGYKKYRVVLDKNGNKALELIDDYDMQNERMMAQAEDMNGGKTTKRKTTKRKTAKRKTAKRKTIKRKSAKRKSGK
jgi:hypothetical protein